MSTTPKKKRRFFNMLLKNAFLAVLILSGVTTMYFYFLPKQVEKKIEINLNVQGSSDLQMTGYAASVKPPGITYGAIVPFTMQVNAEFYNQGDTMLELVEVIARLASCDGTKHIIGLSPDYIKLVDTTYYNRLPDSIGVLIPPGKNRPLELWRGILAADEVDPSTVLSFLLSNDNGTNAWEAFGPPLLNWCKLNVTVVARPVEQAVTDWYQYWDEIPVESLKETRQFLSGTEFNLNIDFAANPIFEELAAKYGNIGIPNPELPGTSSRIITKPDGSQIVAASFNPSLRFVVSYYDEDGKFIGYQESFSFTQSYFEEFLARDGGYFSLVASDKQYNLSSRGEIKNYKVYLELVPK